jgi:hypothetical protein
MVYEWRRAVALAHLDVKDTIKETIGVLLDKDAEKVIGWLPRDHIGASSA